MKPLCIDLFCGYGGWARGFLDAGYRVVGYDNEPKCKDHYPGEFVLQDIRDLDGQSLRYDNAALGTRVRVIVASPPCQRFTTVNQKNRDMEKGLVLVREAKRLIDEILPTYWVIENVRGSFTAISQALGISPFNPGAMRDASIYLWGNLPPFIVPRVRKGWKREPGPPGTFTTTQPPSRDSWENSRIPYPIARAVADACYPYTLGQPNENGNEGSKPTPGGI